MSKVEQPNIIEILRTKMQQDSIGVREASRLSGVSPATISRLLRGIGLPDRITENRIFSWCNGEQSSACRRTSKVFYEYIQLLELRIEKLEAASKEPPR